MKQHLLPLLALALSSTAQAALFDRGNGLVYDSDQNITWAQNATMNGLMTWPEAVAWADGLVLGDYSDWRLPTTPVDSIHAEPESRSEIGHMFYVNLGGTSNQRITNVHNANFNLFSNLLDFAYWSGTENAQNTANVWYFNTVFGLSASNGNKTTHRMYAWAVRDGDVTPVPEPGAAWLLGSGLLGLIAWKRRTNVG